MRGAGPAVAPDLHHCDGRRHSPAAVARPDPSWSLWALGCIALGTVGFELTTVFYNAILPEVAPAGRLGLVSGVPWGIGYVGGPTCLLATLFALVMPDPSPFGLDRAAAEHIRASGLLVAGWMMLFGLPALLALPGPARLQQALARSGTLRAREAARLAAHIAAQPRAGALSARAALLHRWAEHTVRLSAIYAAGMFGMSVEEVVVFGIRLSISGDAGAAAFGPVDDRIGSKWTVVTSLLALIAARRRAARRHQQSHLLDSGINASSPGQRRRQAARWWRTSRHYRKRGHILDCLRSRAASLASPVRPSCCRYRGDAQPARRHRDSPLVPGRRRCASPDRTGAC